MLGKCPYELELLCGPDRISFALSLKQCDVMRIETSATTAAAVDKGSAGREGEGGEAMKAQQLVSLGAEPAAAAATDADAFASSSDFMTDQPNMKWTAQKAQSEREREREKKGKREGEWEKNLPAD